LKRLGKRQKQRLEPLVLDSLNARARVRVDKHREFQDRYNYFMQRLRPEPARETHRAAFKRWWEAFYRLAVRASIRVWRPLLFLYGVK